MPLQDAAATCTKVCRPTDEERLDIERGLLEPGGVVGDEDERAERELAALSQTTAGNHDDGNRKNRNLTRKSLRHLPHGGRQLSWF